MSTNTALEQIKNRVEGHSATPWQVEPYLHSMCDRVRVTSPDDGPDFNTAEDVLPADAELIAAAPKLLAALEAVEALHPRELGGTPDGSFADICSACQSYYPCQTITAIEEALR